MSHGYPLLTEEGSSAISDASGNSLFYTDGRTVWDASTNAACTGGTGLGGGTSGTQSAIVVPKPGATNTWLIFTANTDPNNAAVGNGSPGGINYYTISGTPGTFTVSSGTNLCNNTEVGEGLCILGSTKANMSLWLIARERATGTGSKNIRAYEISNTGVVNATPVISSIASASSFTAWIGTIKSNTCQDQLAFTLYENARGSNPGSVEIYDFDKATGQVTAMVNNISTNHPYGIEFSPNDDYLYYSQLDEGILHQYTLSTNSDNTFPAWDRVGEIGQLQLGPDNRIYVALPGGGSSPEYMGCITTPDNAPATGNFTMNYLQTNTVPATDGYCYRGLPTFPKSIVAGTLDIIPDNGGYCTGTAIPLSYTFTGTVNSQTWSVSPATGWSFTTGASTDPSPTITFTTPNTYTVTLTVVSCSGTYTKDVVFTITSPLTPSGALTCSTGDIVMANSSSDPNAPNYIWYKNGPTYSAGNVIGTGSPATYVHQTGSVMPASICVTVGTTATTVSSLNKTIGAATLPSASESSPKVSAPFSVLSDLLVLKSFDFGFRFSGTYNVTYTIKNGSNTIVYTNTPASFAYTAGTLYTAVVNTSLPAGTGYTITVTINSATGGGTSEFIRGSWGGATNAGEITYAAVASPGTNSFVNLKYDAYDYTVVTTCATPQCYTPPTCTLPVEWADFTVAKVNGHAQILWSTFVEIDNDHFEVERSVDGLNFTVIATKDGHGNSSVVNTYSFTDLETLSGVVYYRIKQVDIDEKYSYSPVRTLDFSSSALATVYPNPSASSFNLQSFVEETLLYTVYDITGRVSQSGNVSGVASFGAELAPGTYFVKIQSGSVVETIKLVKE